MKAAHPLGPFKVAIVSAAHYMEEQDNLVLKKALNSKGAQVDVVDWKNTQIEWHTFDAAVIRTPWDYSFCRQEFLEWASKVCSCCKLYNHYETLLWNTDKAYLRGPSFSLSLLTLEDLASAGIPIVSTVWLKKGRHESLLHIMETNKWESVIFKPNVSAGAKDTHRANQADVAELQSTFDKLVERTDVMVQPYMKTVENPGEISVFMVNGVFLFSVHKTPKKGTCFTQL